MYNVKYKLIGTIAPKMGLYVDSNTVFIVHLM